MLERVPGEVFPKWTPILSAGSYTFTLSMSQAASSPPPIVWRDQTAQLKGSPRKPWSSRFRIDDVGYSDLYWGRLTAGEHYTFAENQIQGVELNEHDRVYVEYSHSLAVKPGILKRISIHITVYDALLAVMGMRQSKVADWAEHYEKAREDLEMIRDGRLGIAEFDDIVLYEDYREDVKLGSSPRSVRPRRA